MNESKSRLLDICIKQFDEDVVFSNESIFELNKSNIELLFKILNNWFFANKLSLVKNLKMFIGNSNALNSIILNYTNGFSLDIDKYIALYQPKWLRYRNNITGKIMLAIDKDAIFINIGTHKFSSFSYIFVSVFHEMIHAYDMHFGKLLNFTIWALSTGATPDIIDYQSHFTSTFKSFNKDFEMETNIPLLTTGNNENFDALCKKTAEDIGLLKEDDDMSNITPIPFPKDMIERYQDSKLIKFSNDGCSFSFSFGIPMPK